jgi:hypothetical protein
LIGTGSLLMPTDDAYVERQPRSRCPVGGAVFYRHNGVELVVQEQSQLCDLWSLRDEWSDSRITFSGSELALLRDALNRLDLDSTL